MKKGFPECHFFKKGHKMFSFRLFEIFVKNNYWSLRLKDLRSNGVSLFEEGTIFLNPPPSTAWIYTLFFRILFMWAISVSSIVCKMFEVIEWIDSSSVLFLKNHSSTLWTHILQSPFSKFHWNSILFISFVVCYFLGIIII